MFLPVQELEDIYSFFGMDPMSTWIGKQYTLDPFFTPVNPVVWRQDMWKVNNIGIFVNIQLYSYLQSWPIARK